MHTVTSSTFSSASADEPRRSRLAVVSLALTLSVLLAPLGFVSSVVALFRIERAHGALRGSGIALASFVISIILCVVWWLASAVMFGVECADRQEEAKRELRALHAAQHAYRAEFGSFATSLGPTGFDPLR